jgi:hypothetical protein
LKKGILHLPKEQFGKLWRRSMLSRKKYGKNHRPALKNMALKMLFKNSWGKRRENVYYSA